MKFDPSHYDLASPDGRITSIQRIDERTAHCELLIENINPNFVGYQLPHDSVIFNIKSTLAQIGVNGVAKQYEFEKLKGLARVQVELKAIGAIAREMLLQIHEGAYIGKLFALDERRRVRDPDYLLRMFGRADRKDEPLLSLGGMHGSDSMILDKVDGRTIAYLVLKSGKVTYDPSIFGFLSTLGKALLSDKKTRELLQLHQQWVPNVPRNMDEDELLLVKTAPLHIRTVFGHVVDSLLMPGYQHTSASILQPDTYASGDIYEFFGKSKREITDVPLEFYTLEPYREYVFFSDRDQLQASIEDPQALFRAFDTAPKPDDLHAATFVVKGEQLHNLTPEGWEAHEPIFQEFPGLRHSTRQAVSVDRYIASQPEFTYLKAIEEGYITSEGILMTRFFPTPLMKRMLLSDEVSRSLKGLYFLMPSSSHGGFFSQEDRALLNDLNKFGIPVFWVDRISGKVLQYTQKKDRESGLFVPLNKVDMYLKSTVFGVYGSNLIAGNFEEALKTLLQGVLNLRSEVNHPLLSKETPLALITGGGPGAMELGNRVATELQMLSCANIADFHQAGGVVNEQKQNPYVEAKMTYRLQQLVERQSEFNLDFPIFVMGGIGTDFEYTLEEVRRKVGATLPTPILLFGEVAYWREKITPRYQANLKAGTIAGSEWVSNCFYCIQTAEQGLNIYSQFFKGTLPIGKGGPTPEQGFIG